MCELFAAEIDKIAQGSKTENEFYDRLAQTFTSARDSSFNQMLFHSGGVVTGRGRNFMSNNGIQAQYRSTHEGQTRHFVAGYVVAATQGRFGTMFLNSQEDSRNENGRADIRVSNLASEIDREVGGSLDAIQNNLANLIRSRFCEPK